MLEAEANTDEALATSVGCIQATVRQRLAADQRAGWWYHLCSESEVTEWN